MNKSWNNSLRPEGAGIEINLLKLNYIIVPAEVAEIEKNIAALLLFYWEKITNRRLKIISENEHFTHPGVWLGKTRKAGLLPLPGKDGITINCDGQNIILQGGDNRGLANAAFTLLSEDFGCRFYAVDYEVIPHLTQASIVNRTYTPQLKLRDPYYFASFNGDWSLRNRTNAPDALVAPELGGHVCYPGKDGRIWHGETLFVHTYLQLLPPDIYYDKHPEYYQLTEKEGRIKHQLCETNPDVQKIVAKNVLKILRENPHINLIDVSKVDGGGTCQCPECKTLNEKEESDAAGMLTLVNYVAQQVEQEFPEVTVSTLAYLETVKLPRTIRPHSNVGIRLCNDKCAWPHPFTPVRSHKEMAEITREWAGACKKLYIWDYNVNFSHYAAPMPNMDVIADNIRFWVENNAEGIMTQGAFQSHGAERDLMRSWVIAQLMWNPQLDANELMDDFIRGYFGGAAPYIAEYNQMLAAYGKKYCAEIDNGTGIRYPMNSSFLKNRFVEKAETIYDKAFAAAANDPGLYKKLERDYLPILYVKISQHETSGDPEYFALINRFERIAREVGFLFPGETMTPGLDWQLEIWRSPDNSSMIKVIPAGGLFEDHLDVEISTRMSAVRLVYTINGNEPKPGDNEIRSGSKITINDDCVLKVSMFMMGSCVGAKLGEYSFSRSN
jgi:hypothetical protein